MRTPLFVDNGEQMSTNRFLISYGFLSAYSGASAAGTAKRLFDDRGNVG
jgi:hypothetical protein